MGAGDFEGTSEQTVSRVHFGPFWNNPSDHVEFTSLTDIESPDTDAQGLTSNKSEYNDCSSSLDFGMYVWTSQMQSGDCGDEKREFLCQSTLFGSKGKFFSPQEMFGLYKDTSVDSNDEDGDSTEECLICLTEQKEVLLLPCRHFCVCSECFVHVDKCPVCRAAFDEYVVLENDHETINMPIYRMFSRESSRDHSVL